MTSIAVSSGSLTNQSFEIDTGFSAQTLTFPTYTIVPCGNLYSYSRQVVDAATSAVAPAFVVQANGSTFNIAVTAPANAGSYNFKILATESSAAGLTNSANTFTVVLYYCLPANIVLSSSSITRSILGPSTTVTWSKDASNAGCGAYTAVATSTTNYTVSVSTNQISVSIPSTATTGTYSAVITV